jgi:pimeloyl-ACP methyl ester carboxylesterase
VVGDQLAAITHKVPTLLVWGADDSMITTDVAVQAQSVLPDTRLAIIENTGHVPYFERPDPFNDIVHAFLTDRLSTEPTQRY